MTLVHRYRHGLLGSLLGLAAGLAYWFAWGCRS